MKKKYDLAVKTETYTNKNGEQKNVWKNIGAVFQTDNGFSMKIEKTFNPAGVPGDPESGSIWVSMFEPKQPQAVPQGKSQYQQPTETINDDIPF